MYGKSTSTILTALIALSFIAGIAVPTGAMAARDQWLPQFKSSTYSKTVKNLRSQRAYIDAQDDEDDDANEWPEWADEAF
jgi:hypothetical protein